MTGKKQEEEKSIKVIAEYESITVENNIFDLFMSACEKAQTPNKSLWDAVAFTKEQGIK